VAAKATSPGRISKAVANASEFNLEVRDRIDRPSLPNSRIDA
jgi:hypothetical protein